MITAPSIFGKVPALGDFVRHNAPARQVEAWRRWFDFGSEPGSARTRPLSGDGPAPHWLHLTPPCLASQPRLRVAEPVHFILRSQRLQFPSDAGFVMGVMAASHDRVGRRYPLVVWQAASADGAERLLAAPASWLCELMRLVHEHIHLPGQAGLAAAVDALWSAHRPGWQDRVGALFGRLAVAGQQAACGDLPCDGLTGRVTMRNDWPTQLLRSGMSGCVWQAGNGGAIDIDGIPAIRRIVSGL